MSSSSTWAFTNFYPRPPRGGRPPSQDRRGTTQNFYPRPPRGGRHVDGPVSVQLVEFLSTPSARRATGAFLHFPGGGSISIHALREEGDRRSCRDAVKLAISIHALREEGDPALPPWLSLHRYFYPRPPRGGRQELTIEDAAKVEFLSTPSARRATKGYRDGLKFDPFLSTPSARRATKDTNLFWRLSRYFYPRPPRGGRLATRRLAKAMRYFYPRPPRGGRHAGINTERLSWIFLSTPSARRATQSCRAAGRARQISIHALREEGDSHWGLLQRKSRRFLSTPSARRATDSIRGR